MRVLNEVLLAAGNASGDLTSEHGLLAHAGGYSIQVVITGTATGTLTLEGSDDPVPDANFNVRTYPVTNWTIIDDSSEPVTGAGTVVYNVRGVFYNWVRVQYDSTSGSGTMTIRINTKGF